LWRDVTLLLLLKGAALTVLWMLFFSSSHQTPVTAARAGSHLGIAGEVPRGGAHHD
jgi:hypothetical protein